MKNLFKKNKLSLSEVKTKKGELTQTPFNIITNSEILTDDDVKSLIPLTGELQTTFKKSQVFRTKTEMEVSVLNSLKHPTAASKYWQSMREQNVMFHELVMLSYEYRKNIVEIKQLLKKIDKEVDILEKELLEIEVEKKLFISKNQERTAQDRIREIKMWSEIKEREAENMSEGELADVDSHQLISYTARWLKQRIAMGDKGSPSERQNLIGQMISGLNACKKNKLLPDVVNALDSEIIRRLNDDYDIDLTNI